jgi:hypothetical protein
MNAGCLLTEATSKVGLGVWAETVTAMIAAARENQRLLRLAVIQQALE